MYTLARMYVYIGTFDAIDFFADMCTRLAKWITRSPL